MSGQETMGNAAHAELHYPAAWLQSGFLTATLLQDQVDNYRQHGGPLEHYRYASFRAVLEYTTGLNDEEIDRFINLTRMDEDRTMAQSALVDLIHWRGLTDAQFQRIRNLPSFDSPLLHRIGERQQLLRALQHRDIDATLVERIIQSNDATVQRALLGRRDTTRRGLEALRDHGATRAIRNIARHQLREDKQRDEWRKHDGMDI